MKNINIKFGLMLVSLLFAFIFTSCDEEKTYMEPGVVDLNANIIAMDKTVAQPGDVVTFTGTGLDKVYKVMLNTDNVPIDYEATANELKVKIPALPPLGDVITVNIFFSGKGLAKRAIKLISPPVIYELSPAAAHVGDKISVNGKELHLSQTVKLNGVTVPFTLVSDKSLTFVVPVGFTGGALTIETASGGISTSPAPLKVGTEVMINNYDGLTKYYTSLSSNGNMDNDVEQSEEFPRGKFWTFTFKDNATSWGGNMDFFFAGQPVYDNSLITLSIDIKMSKAMNVSIMVEGPANVYGLTKSLVVGWQTIIIPFSEMGTGYGNGDPFGQVAAFNTLKGVKIQPPAGATSGNFGETISVDNIKFLINN